jgi:hypothetical protein
VQIKFNGYCYFYSQINQAPVFSSVPINPLPVVHTARLSSVPAVSKRRISEAFAATEFRSALPSASTAVAFAGRRNKTETTELVLHEWQGLGALAVMTSPWLGEAKGILQAMAQMQLLEHKEAERLWRLAKQKGPDSKFTQECRRILLPVMPEMMERDLSYWSKDKPGSVDELRTFRANVDAIQRWQAANEMIVNVLVPQMQRLGILSETDVRNLDSHLQTLPENRRPVDRARRCLQAMMTNEAGPLLFKHERKTMWHDLTGDDGLIRVSHCLKERLSEYENWLKAGMPKDAKLSAVQWNRYYNPERSGPVPISPSKFPAPWVSLGKEEPQET